MEGTMKRNLLTAAAASLMVLGAICFAAEAAPSGSGTGHAPRHGTIHRHTSTTQHATNQGGEITSFSSSSAGGVGVVHPPRK